MDAKFYNDVQIALSFLFQNLRNAQKMYLRADAQNGGRDGIIRALDSVIEFLRHFEEPREEHLALPLVKLTAALRDLENGTQYPLVAKRKKGGKPGNPITRKEMMGAASVALRKAVKQGVNEEEMAKNIAKLLNKLGIENQGNGKKNIEATTVMEWKNKIKEGSADDPARKFEILAMEEYPSSDIVTNNLLNGLKALVIGLRVKDEQNLLKAKSTLPPG